MLLGIQDLKYLYVYIRHPPPLAEKVTLILRYEELWLNIYFITENWSYLEILYVPSKVI